MKRITLALAALVASAGLAAADPLEGLWRTIADDNGNSGLIEVKPCPGNGAQLCGTLIKAFDGGGNEIQTDNVGTTIISQTVAQGGGQYRGKVYSPDRDRTYNSRLQLSGNTLAVSGCVLGVCRDGGSWTRAN